MNFQQLKFNEAGLYSLDIQMDGQSQTSIPLWVKIWRKRWRDGQQPAAWLKPAVRSKSP